MSALGSVSKTTLSKTGDTRRVVVNALMMKGMSGSHAIATGTAVAMQRHLQDLERRRAVELLLTGPDDKESDLPDDNRRELLKLGIRSISRDDMDSLVSSTETDEDNEAMEAIRLILIQYHVGQGSLKNSASKSLVPQRLRPAKKRHSEGTMMHFGREFPEIDAGDVDPRLIGCGILPPAVLQALTLRKANMISNGELLELVKKDLEFVRKANLVEADAQKDKLQEDSAFWGRFAFGERWAEKRSRIAASSPDATKPGWDLNGVIVKANDDLRQEAFVMQLIELCREAFDEAGLELWLLPYRILATGRTTGIIEMVRNAMSFDALKKRPGYGRGGLREHLQRMTQFAADPSEAFKTAQKNFVRSLAAYSLMSYLFLFKDRHNGNILLDTAGHVIHIDFGFVFGVAPGGSFSLEISTPFKLTEEMIDVMDGLRSSLFSEFITLFCCGFLALQAHCDTFCTVVEISCRGSTFKCFEGRHSDEIVGKLRERFQPDLGKEESVAFCLDLIKDATQSYGTAQYDYFQYLSQGIAA
jgi:phosphatidylinositol 4-kinase